MRIKGKILISIILVSLIFLFMMPIKSNAALQANGTGGTATLAWWLPNVRLMEKVGGTLGLSDTINTTNLLSTAEKSNNLDIHMQKNTEYGAMAILSASAYGNQNKINSGETTTGNKSGIYIYLNSEWTASGSLSKDSAFVNANSKYKNRYSYNSVGGKVGDATTETAGWHGGASSNLSNSKYYGVRRSLPSGIFSYYEAANNISYYSRAVIVVGEGF